MLYKLVSLLIIQVRILVSLLIIQVKILVRILVSLQIYRLGYYID